MQRSISLSLSLGDVAALALSNAPLLPAIAQEDGSADDLGVMEINLSVDNGGIGVLARLRSELDRTPEGANLNGPIAITLRDAPVLMSQMLSRLR